MPKNQIDKDFDPVDHANRLERVTLYEHVIKEQDIEIVRLHAQAGGGSAKFRELMKMRLEKNLSGLVHTYTTTTYGSPLMFYLYMGMTPIAVDGDKKTLFEEQEIDYLATFYLQDDPAFFKAQALLIKINEKTDWVSFIQQCTEENKMILKYLVHAEKTRWGHVLGYNPADLTDNDLLQNKALFLEIIDAGTNRLTYFVMEVLEAMKRNLKSGEERVNLNCMGNFSLQMSEKGFERWEKAILENKEFIPFKDLEHLNLDEALQYELEQIMAAKANQSEPIDQQYQVYLQELSMSRPKKSTTMEDLKNYYKNLDQIEAKERADRLIVKRVLDFSCKRYGKPPVEVKINTSEHIDTLIQDDYMPIKRSGNDKM